MAKEYEARKGLSNLPEVTPLISNRVEDPGQSVCLPIPPLSEGDPLCFFIPSLGGEGLRG